MQNRISMDFNATDDSSSLDSLSFAGLVCIQDQQSKSPTKRPNRNVDNDFAVDQEFEFVSGTSLQDLNNNNKNPHQCHDMIISSNSTHLLPLELLLKSAESQAANSNREEESHDKRSKTSANSRSSLSFGQKLFQSFVSPCRECQTASPTVKAHAASPAKRTYQVKQMKKA